MCRKETVSINSGQPMASRKRRNLHTMRICKSVRHDDKSAVWLARPCGNGSFELELVSNRRGNDLYVLYPQLAGRPAGGLICPPGQKSFF